MTGGVLPLDDGGKMAWRRVGDAADFTLVPQLLYRDCGTAVGAQHGRMVCGSVASA